MCLILFSWKQHPEYQLVLTANRDEFYDRPTAPAAFWKEHHNLLAGRDLKAGGTWIGMTKAGRFAALTNYRDPANIKENAPSRGQLTTDFLLSDQSPQDYLLAVAEKGGEYNGFNLLVSDNKELWYYSNYEREVRAIAPGTYGLSNHLINSDWPKVQNGKEMLAQQVESRDILPESLFQLINQKETYPDEELPQTGVSLEWERALSAMHIVTEKYGTVSSTVILTSEEGRVLFGERVFPTLYRQASDKLFEFTVS